MSLLSLLLTRFHVFLSPHHLLLLSPPPPSSFVLVSEKLSLSVLLCVFFSLRTILSLILHSGFERKLLLFFRRKYLLFFHHDFAFLILSFRRVTAVFSEMISLRLRDEEAVSISASCFQATRLRLDCSRILGPIFREFLIM